MKFRTLRSTIEVMLTLAAVCLLFFWPVVTGRAWLPHGGGDAVSFLYPMYRFIAASFARGEMPLWNPNQYAGYPLIADNQAGMFYPPHLLLFLLRPTFSYQAIQSLVVGHVWWAGLGMYVSVRGLWDGAQKIGRMPALVAAVAFMLSDLFITHLGNLNLIAVAAWLPWAFWTLHRSLRLRHVRPRRAAVHLLTCGLIIGVSTLAGHAQMTFFIAFLLGVYALWRTLANRDWLALPAVSTAGAIGIGIAAVTLLPTLEMNPLTRRGIFSYAESVNYSLPWQATLGLLAPGFYGRGAVAFWGDWERVEVGYMGILPLLLAIYGVRALLFGRNTTSQQRRHTLFFLLGTLFFFFLALGGNTPFHRLILGWAQLPFQVPARFVLLMNFCTAMLAAIGMAYWLEKEWGDQRQPFSVSRWLVVLGIFWLVSQLENESIHRSQMSIAIGMFATFGIGYAMLLILPGYFKVRRSFIAWLLLALLSAELIATGQHVELEHNNPLAGYQNELATTYLQQNAGVNRIDEATAAWQPSAAQLVGLYSAGGVFNPLELATHAAIMGSVGYRGSPVYSLMGIKYIVSGKSVAPGDTAFIIPVYNEGLVDVYLNNNALPRVMMIYQNQVVDSHDAAFAALHSDIDFTQTVIVEHGEPLTAPPAPHQIGIIEYRNNHVVFDVFTEDRGYFLLTDMYYPNWEATVNGVSAEIIRADYAFRAILLDPGQHRIEMTFNPPSWQIGWKISILSLLLVAAAYLYLGQHTFFALYHRLQNYDVGSRSHNAP